MRSTKKYRELFEVWESLWMQSYGHLSPGVQVTEEDPEELGELCQTRSRR